MIQINFSFSVQWLKILLFNVQSTYFRQAVVSFLLVLLLLFESKHVHTHGFHILTHRCASLMHYSPNWCIITMVNMSPWHTMKVQNSTSMSSSEQQIYSSWPQYSVVETFRFVPVICNQLSNIYTLHFQELWSLGSEQKSWKETTG